MNWQHISALLGARAADAEAWAAEQRRRRDELRGRAFPVSTTAVSASSDGAANWYRVIGVQRETEQDVEMVIEARTPANASAKAELRGVVVTSVDPVQTAVPL